LKVLGRLVGGARLLVASLRFKLTVVDTLWDHQGKGRDGGEESGIGREERGRGGRGTRKLGSKATGQVRGGEERRGEARRGEARRGDI